MSSTDKTEVLPAYAGMIPLQVATFGVSGGAPRVCGDDPTTGLGRRLREQCSPRMRG